MGESSQKSFGGNHLDEHLSHLRDTHPSSPLSSTLLSESWVQKKVVLESSEGPVKMPFAAC